MDALVQQFAAPGQIRVGPPFLVVAGPPPVAIDGADKHQRSDGALPHQFVRLPNCWVMAMVETGLEEAAIPLRGLDHPGGLSRISPERLLAQDMLALGQRSGGDGCQRAVHRGYHDRIEVLPLDQPLPVAHGLGTGFLGYLGGPGLIQIGHRDHLVPGRLRYRGPPSPD